MNIGVQIDVRALFFYTLISANSFLFGSIRDYTCLHYNGFHPYFTGRDNSFLIDTCTKSLLDIPISQDPEQIDRFIRVTGKLLEKYTKRWTYFPLSECTNPGCLLSRKSYERIPNSRIELTEIVGKDISKLYYGCKDDVFRLNIISNATGSGFLMEYSILRYFYLTIHKEGSVFSQKENKAKQVDFHCIDPIFGYLMASHCLFSSQEKAYTRGNIDNLTAGIKHYYALSPHNKRKSAKEITATLLPLAIDKLIKLSVEELGIEVYVHTYPDINSFIEYNKHQCDKFPLCYTVDLFNVLGKKFSEYQKSELKYLVDFFKPSDNTTMYWLDAFGDGVPQILYG